MASCTSAAAPRCVHERCYTTLVFRSNQSASASPVQDAMLQLWLRRMRRFTALPIVVMHANVPSPRRLMNATAHQPVDGGLLVACHGRPPWPHRKARPRSTTLTIPRPPRHSTPTQALRLQLRRVGLLVVNPPGTLPWYKEQYTKLHAWSLPCRQVAQCVPYVHVHVHVHRAFVLGLGGRHRGIVELPEGS